MAAMKDHSRSTRGELLKMISELEKNARLSERQKSKHTQDLSDSGERLRAILKTAVEGILTIDEKGAIESFNRAAEKTFGYRAAEVIGHNVKMLMPEPYRHQHDGYLENYHHTGHAKIIGIGREVAGRRKDGTIFPLILAVSEVKLAEGRIYAGFIRDITVEKAAEKALLHYAALVRSSDDAIIGKTLEGYITSWNKGAETLFGFKSDEAVGRHISILIPPNRMNEEAMIMGKIGSGESVEHYETIRRRKDGRMIDISVTVSPIRDAAGKIIGASKVARDITERIRLEREILEISEREQRRIGNDLHDGLCQELAGIELMCQVVEQKLAAKSKAESGQLGEIAQHIRAAISHTRKLARGLSPVELEINGFVSALEELAAHTRQLSHVDCRFEYTTQVLIRNNISATHLYRITQEAINNAIRHGRAKKIVIALKPKGEKICLSVTDDGAGFATESRPTSGMGLQTMKYRAGVLNADLQIRSTAGGGATVTCVFEKNL
jgi:PAS domain S-box-containing protein